MRSSIARIALTSLAGTALVIAAVFAPVALRTLGMFRVQRVEVIGSRHLSAAAAARSAGITLGSNVFDDPTPWISALRAHPLVADVRIERRLPGTIVLRIDEAEPVAFARTPELRPIAADGRILPADPAVDDLDLPVLTVRTRVSALGRAVDRETLAIVQFLDIVAHDEPGLAGWISEAGMRGDAIRLVLRNAADAEVLVNAQPTPKRLRELHLTLAELAAPPVADDDGRSARRAAPDLARVRRIDVRFQDQVVVSLHKGKS